MENGKVEESSCFLPNSNTTSPLIVGATDDKEGNGVLQNDTDDTPCDSPSGITVSVTKARKSYGSGCPDVIKDLNMTVRRGTIYSLLGASGCGKTTLLSCVVGIRHLNQGNIQVFGAAPGTKESGVPGNRVGYMPQDLALYLDFSINESLNYFGTLYSMSRDEIEKNKKFLLQFLSLPDPSRRIKTLSGGQRRRVSLSLSLIHSPELLILDEPTVGVDPLLRESIWRHLCQLVSKQRTTVIITTHYIEEARESDTIGFMRDGRMLFERKPSELFSQYGTNSLEKIVLKVCQNDDGSNESQESGTEEDLVKVEVDERCNGGTVATEQVGLETIAAKDDPNLPTNGFSNLNFPSFYTKLKRRREESTGLHRVYALVLKNATVMSRNYILVLFMMIVPTIQIFLICMAIGNDPKPMWMGVVNQEVNYTQVCLGSENATAGESEEDDEWKDECEVDNLSCKYLASLPSDVIYLREFASEEKAIEAVKLGKVWGFIKFPKDFTDHLYMRSSMGYFADKEVLRGSKVYVQMDQSNKQIALTLKRIIMDSYLNFVKELLQLCGRNVDLAELPVKFMKPIYGSDDTDFREFIAPSILLGLLFFFPLCSSGISYIWDKKQGTLERARIAGVQTWEVMTAFFITEGCVLLVQCAISVGVLTMLFGIQVQGSRMLIVILGVLIGMGGVSMGFVIASLCKEEIEAVLLAMAAFFPNILLAGMIWPVEGMPIVVQYLVLLLPCTLAGESVRSIVSRGWGFTHPQVWPGFATTVLWIACYWIMTICIHKRILSKQ